MTSTPSTLTLAGHHLVADPSGALLWPDRDLLVVADLHLEKGSAFAARGRMLPPYDTRATLDRLAAVLERVRPAHVLCLGDSFHDRHAANRMEPGDVARLTTLTMSADWVWITGNHDPEPPDGFGGRIAAEVVLDGLTFRHEAVPGAVAELSGHLHPVAALRLPGHRRVRERCFAFDGAKLILPAFGAYAGGLNVLNPVIAGLLRPRFDAYLLARGRIHRFPREALCPDGQSYPQ